MSQYLITRGSTPRLLLEGLADIFGYSYEEHEPEWTHLFEQHESRKAYEQTLLVDGFGAANEKPEAQGMFFDTRSQGYGPQYINKTYAIGYIISQEALDDDLYDVLEEGSKCLGRSLRETKEIVGANIYNRAFNSSFTMPNGDGQPLCSASHVLGPNDNDTDSNILSTAAALSQTSLEAIITQIGGAVDPRGLKTKIEPLKLVVPVALQWQAARLTKSVLEPGTGNNAINPLQGIFEEGVLVSHYLTSPTAWFARTDISQGLKMYNRQSPKFGEDNEFSSLTYRYMAYERYVAGWDRYQGLYGSNAA